MKLNQIESSYLYEGLSGSARTSMYLWESAGIKLKEATLTADQIQQIFANIEQGATAAGGNRTLIGQGKDAADAVKKAYDDLVSKVQNSAPMKNADSMYDQVAEKLKQATGGDQGVMKYVQKYRDFAKEHPIAQSFIYSALIAAAGISGVGAGGAAVLGLLKMTDKLLQGEKFSTSLGKGLATGATAYAAGQIGKAMQGGDQASATQAAAQTAGGPIRMNVDAWQANPYYAEELAKGLNDPGISQAWKDQFVAQLNRSVANPSSNQSLATAWQTAKKAASLQAGNPYGVQESVELSERQIRVIFGTTQALMLREGVWDSIKSGAGKIAGAVADKAKTVGHNLTTKVTANKLSSAWKDAGSPTDSNELATFLQSQGIDKSVVDSVYQQLNLPVTQSLASQDATAQATPAINLDDLKSRILQLTIPDRQTLLKYIQGQLGTA